MRDCEGCVLVLLLISYSRDFGVSFPDAIRFWIKLDDAETSSCASVRRAADILREVAA